MSANDAGSLDDGRITFDTERPEPLVRERDPVCGMDVSPSTAPASRELDGKTYWFCSNDCAETFDADPTLFTGEASS